MNFKSDQQSLVFMLLIEYLPNGLWIIVGDRLARRGINQCGDIRKPSFEEVTEFGNSAYR